MVFPALAETGREVPVMRPVDLGDPRAEPALGLGPPDFVQVLGPPLHGRSRVVPRPGVGRQQRLDRVGELGEFPADPVQGGQDLAVTGDRPAELVDRRTKSGQGLANVPVVLVLAVIQRAELLGEPLHLQECGGDAAVLAASRRSSRPRRPRVLRAVVLAPAPRDASAPRAGQHRWRHRSAVGAQPRPGGKAGNTAALGAGRL